MEMVGFGKAGKERASPLSPRDLLQKRGNAKAQLDRARNCCYMYL